MKKILQNIAIGLIIFGAYEPLAEASAQNQQNTIRNIASVKQEDLFQILKDTNGKIGNLFGDLLETYKKVGNKKEHTFKEATNGMKKFFKYINSKLDKIKKSKKSELIEEIIFESSEIFEEDYKIGLISDEIGPGYLLKNRLYWYIRTPEEISIIFKIVNYLNLLKNELEKCAANSDGKYITSENVRDLADMYGELSLQIDSLVTDDALSKLSDEDFEKVKKLMSSARRASYDNKGISKESAEKSTSSYDLAFPAEPAEYNPVYEGAIEKGKPDYVTSFPAE